MSGAARWDLADEEAVWAAVFAAGGIHDPAVPAGEAVAFRAPDVVVADVRPGVRPVVTRVRYRGTVVVTDRRVLLVDEAGRELRWDDGVETVFADANGCGAVVVPTPAALDAGGCAWALLPPSALSPEPPERWVTLTGLVMWNRVVAAFRASRGELEAWTASVEAAVRRPS